MKSIVLPNGELQATTRIVQLFVSGVPCLNEIKSLTDVPFIALTATATQKTKYLTFKN